MDLITSLVFLALFILNAVLSFSYFKLSERFEKLERIVTELEQGSDSDV